MANLFSLLEEELPLAKLKASLKAAIMRSCFSASAEDLVNALWSAVAAQIPTDPTATISLEDLKLKLSTAWASVTDNPCAFEESSFFAVDSVPPSLETFDLTPEEPCGVGECGQPPLAPCTPDDARAREDERTADSANTEEDAERNTELEKAKQDNTEVEKISDLTPVDARAREDECNAEKMQNATRSSKRQNKTTLRLKKLKQAAASTVTRCN